MNSKTSKLETLNKLKALKETLSAQGVNVETLGIVTVEGESIYGECEWKTDKEVIVTNPKRLVRLQRMEQNGLSVQFGLVNYDLMMRGGLITVVSPTIIISIEKLNEESQIAYLGLYMEHLNKEIMHKAVEAGLVIPKTSISP